MLPRPFAFFALCLAAGSFSPGLTVAESSQSPNQSFERAEDYTFKPFYGGSNLKVALAETPAPTGCPALEIRAECPRDNAGVDVSWTFPATNLDGRTFSLQLQAPDGPATYFRAVFLDETGKQVGRNTFFGVGGSDWRTVKVSADGTAGGTIEPPDPAPGRKIAGITLQFCGNPSKPVHVLISDFAETTSTLSASETVTPPKTTAPASTSLKLSAGPSQSFESRDNYLVKPYYGAANLRVSEVEIPGTPARRAVEIEADCPQDNAGVEVAWTFPPTALDGKTFSFQIQTPKGPVPYVRARFLDESGKQISRNNYFGTGGENWRTVNVAVDGKAGGSIEPPNLAPGQKVAGITLQFCGTAGKPLHLRIAEFTDSTGKVTVAAPAPARPAVNVLAEAKLTPTAGPSQNFESKETYQIKPYYGASNLRILELEKPGPTGRPALDLQADCPGESAGFEVMWTFPPTILDDKILSLHILAPEGPVSYFRALFLDENGRQISRNNFFGVGGADWRAVNVAINGKTGAASVEPAAPAPGQKVAGIVLQICGKAGKPVHAVISDFGIAGESSAKRAEPIAADVAPTVSKGDVAIWLNPAKGYRLDQVRIGELQFERNFASMYPRFTFTDTAGKRLIVDGDDPGFTVKAKQEGKDKITVRYSRDGTAIELVYSTTTVPRCDINVLEEGNLKLVALGTDKMLGVEITRNDYGILPDGQLYHRLDGKPPRSFKRSGNGDNSVPNFGAAKLGNRVVYYKPLTASQQMNMAIEKADNTELLWFGGNLFFRPSKAKNPALKLCHPTLAWQLETAGDVNQDGEVDWVDCGIAYRDRYLKKNPHLDPSVRNSLKLYHGIPGDTYEQLARTAEKMDYCSTLWWVKGAMETLIRPGTECHPYTITPDPTRGDRAGLRERYASADAHVGLYYGHDYLDNENKDWPTELVKLNEEEQPFAYYKHDTHQLLYKDNVRGMATGLLQKHYDEILRVCGLTKGDPIMLDTFTAYGREGYHPDFPATAQIETETKRELARYLKEVKGLTVAGEGVIEGTEDMIDFGAILLDYHKYESAKPWNQPIGQEEITPLLSIIYHGRTYTGISWYEYRNPDPNWAASLIHSSCMWQWSTGHYPDNMYAFGARMFFNQNIAWIANADAEIVDIDHSTSEFRIRFSNGNTIWTDPVNRSWRLEANGVMYDGFTPFNDRGVMAILKQGDFDVTLPVKEMLEILPSQPDREQLDVKIEPTADGRVRVHGNFSRIPWQMAWLHKPSGQTEEIVEMRPAPPVLMLRRVQVTGY